MKAFPLYILAGGQSRRFGSDKARATINGRPLIQRIADTLRPAVTSVTVVADAAGKYQDLSLPTIPDTAPGSGPLAGLAAALQHGRNHADCEWVWVVACDWTNPSLDLLQPLAEQAATTTTAVVYGEQHYQPFPGLYHYSIQPVVTQHLQCDKLSMHQLLDDLNGTRVLFHSASKRLMHANTMDEFAHQIALSKDTARH